MKAAIVVLSDPAGGSEEALGRLFNALASAHDFKSQGDDVTVLFQGAGTRWPAVVAEPDHPANGLYTAVLDRVAGVSAACSDVFGAAEGAAKRGIRRVSGNEVAGTAGLPSLRRLAEEGYTVLTF